MITIEQAEQAGIIAAAIKARQEKVTQIQTAIAGNWLVSKFAAVWPEENEIQLILDRLDADTSAQALQFALAVYEGQLTALQAQLDAIGA